MKQTDSCIQRRRFLTSTAVASILPLVLWTAIPVPAQARSSYGIQGEFAPEIYTDYWIDRDGNPSSYSIKAQSGKWVYLYCFQDWCPGCHSHGFPGLQKLTTAFPDSPVLSIAAVQTVFEGFFSNTVEDVRKLQQRYDLPISMGHDAGDPQGDHRPETMKNYRTGGTPWTIIIDPNGVVAFNDFHINIDRFITFIEKQQG